MEDARDVAGLGSEVLESNFRCGVPGPWALFCTHFSPKGLNNVCGSTVKRHCAK